MTQTMPLSTWGESVARHLLDDVSCPVCQWTLADGCCARCGSDFRGPIAVDLWNASVSAANAMRARDELLRRVPVIPLAPVGEAPRPAQAPLPSDSRTAAPPRPAPEAVPQSSATLQSVLATAGAGLFAVAAIVFTYFNPDLADKALRGVIVGLVTLLFLGGAWLLSRRGLRFSAEAVGGLGLVFGGLDIHAVAQLAAPEIDPWLTAAGATAVAGTVMMLAGSTRGIRIWQWTSLVAMSLVPAMIGAGIGTPLAAALGAIGVAFAATGLVEWLRPRRFEQITLTAVQLIAALCSFVLLWRTGDDSFRAFLLTAACLLLLMAAHATIASRRMLAPLWGIGAGGAASAAVVFTVLGATTDMIDESWLFAIIPTAAAAALVLVGAVVPLPRTVPRGFVVAGSLAVLAGPALVLFAFAALTGVTALGDVMLSRRAAGAAGGAESWALILGLAGMSAGLAAFSAAARRREGIRALATAPARLSLVVGAVAVLVLGSARVLPLPASVAVLAGSVIVVGAVLRHLKAAAAGARIILITAAHVAVIASAVIAWGEPSIVPFAGIGTLLAVAALAWALPPRLRFLYVGAGFAYALTLVSTALGVSGVGGIAQLCLTATAGLAVAIATTYTPRVGARSWQAVLVVSAVPFAIGILQVIVERSGWTALSTGLMFALAASLLVTRRPGLTVAVRTTAAGMLVPALAVVIVCLGAQLLPTSGSPVTLPIVAVLVALVLPSTPAIRGALLARGHGATTADAARLAIEASSLLTGAIATALALWRDAAGTGTAFLVLVILGLGAAAAALFAERRYAWAVSAAAFTGALWCVWGIVGVDLLEAYLLPPTLGAAVVAVLMTLRGKTAVALYAAGLLVAIGPLLALVAVVEPDPAGRAEILWRAGGMLVCGWLLLGVSALFGRQGARGRVRRLRMLRTPTLIAAGLAASVGTIQGIRIGLGWDMPELHGAWLFLFCLGVSAVAALALMFAGRGIRKAAREGSTIGASRWLGAPAAIALAAGTWFAIERDWFSIWAMWTLMLGYLLAVVATASVIRRRATSLPPVWLLFSIAFVTAVVAWSPRELRVEWFSLPLGGFLLLAGALAMAQGTGGAPTLNSWPGRWRGSWALLAPGIVTAMSASIVSTFTDPLTWRAILVMVLALAGILVGSRGRLAAPFLIGLIVLPIENVFVFSVQIGRGVESMPWWITLAVMGAVLLIIAVTAERRTGESGSVAARIRDLR